MEKMKESPYIINGRSSWLHCLRIKAAKVCQSDSRYHYHDYVELLYFLEGSAELIANEKHYPCRTGDLAVINAGEPHDVLFNRDADYICVKFLPQILYSETESLFEFQYEMPFLLDETHRRVFHTNEIPRVRQWMLEIMEEWCQAENAYELVIRGNILKTCAAIFRCWHQEGAYTHSGSLPEYIKKALAYISENYGSLTEGEVAQYCGVSYHFFSAAFRQAMNKSFSEYLTQVRIREAKKLLATTQMSVTEIAMEVGFATASHFIKRFRQQVGTTPKQLRLRQIDPAAVNRQ